MLNTVGKLAMVAVSLVVLSGCGNSQPAPANQSSTQGADGTTNFKIGKTTKDEVIAVLGQPNGQSMNSNGEEVLFYHNRHITGKAFIPFYYGSDRVRSKQAKYTFKNNVLTAMSSSSAHY